MSFWSSLDQLLDDTFLMPKPNPFPPLGSGKMARPALLEIPGFDPPPPTPSPQYKVQLPVKPAAKPVWNSNPGRKRMLKIWDYMPDSAVSPAPQVQTGEHRNSQQRTSASKSGLVRRTVSPMKLPRAAAHSNLTTLAHKPSPTSAECRQALDYQCSQPQAPTFGFQRKPRGGLHCGVDLSFLWDVLIEFVFDIPEEEALPQSHSCEGRLFHSLDTTLSCLVRVDAASREARCDADLLHRAVQETKGPLVPVEQEPRKGGHSSPMSVLTPLSTEKSSAGSSPWQSHSLLAFVGRDCSP